MGTSLINDALTNNVIENDTKVKVILVSNKNKKDKKHACYIHDFWKPVALPFSAIFNESGIISNFKKDSNIELIENYFGLSIERLIKLINNNRSVFDEYSNLFFEDFNIHPIIYKDKNIPNFENFKKISDKFVLISDDNDLEIFESPEFSTFFGKYKIVFNFHKNKQRLKINILNEDFDTKEFIKYKELDCFDNSNFRKMFKLLYENNIPLFLTKDKIDLIKEIESLALMIYDVNNEKFFNKIKSKKKAFDDFNKSFDEMKNNFKNEINNTYFRLNHIFCLNRFLPDEMPEYSIIFKLLFNKLDFDLMKLLREKEYNKAEELFDSFFNEEFKNNLCQFIRLVEMMSCLNIQFNTYMYAIKIDKLELEWNKFCTKQSETMTKKHNDIF